MDKSHADCAKCPTLKAEAVASNHGSAADQLCERWQAKYEVFYGSQIHL